MLASCADIVRLKDVLLGLPTQFVIDHAGLPDPAAGVAGRDFAVLLELLDTGKCWVKLSGPMRFSRQKQMPYGDTLPFYKALVERAPARVVWGSDWPHIHYNVGVMPNDGDLLDMLSGLGAFPTRPSAIASSVENPLKL